MPALVRRAAVLAVAAAISISSAGSAPAQPVHHSMHHVAGTDKRRCVRQRARGAEHYHAARCTPRHVTKKPRPSPVRKPVAAPGQATSPAQAGTGATTSNDPFAQPLSLGTPGTADPSGEPMPIGDRPGWHQVFADDFTTGVPIGGFSGCTHGVTPMESQCTGLPSSVATKWWAYPDTWPDTQHNGQYYPSQVLSIHDGMLDYYLHTANGIHMVAAAVPKIPGGVNGGGLQHGAYVARFRSDQLYGYKTAWLLWPDSENWPADGEIDFPEGDLNGQFGGFMHYMGATSGTQQAAYPTAAGYDSWHTAIIEWTAGYCRFILDGQIVGTSTGNVPSDPMHWVLQTETAIDGTVPSDTASGHVQIDWVAAYTPTS